MIEDLSNGVLGFLAVAAFLFIIMEASQLLEELLGVRIELRKGFTGAKTNVTKILSRHLLQLLRMGGTFKQQMGAGFKYIFIFVAAGLLPTWDGEVSLPITHSVWIFLGLIVLGPILHLVFEWLVKRGAGWPIVLISAERAIGSSTVLFILSITLVAMTGSDSFSDLQSIQRSRGWLIIHNPLAIPLMIAFSVTNLFTSFETIFSRKGDEKQEGWSFNELLLPLRRSVWALFIANVFLGGADTSTFFGSAELLIKCVAVNIVSSMISHLFFQLREDQAESFILWRLGPVSVLILGLCLLFPGGVA